MALNDWIDHHVGITSGHAIAASTMTMAVTLAATDLAEALGIFHAAFDAVSTGFVKREIHRK